MAEGVQALAAVFGACILLLLVMAGLVMMLSPSHGREVAKNALIALALFVLGSMLVQASCLALRRTQALLGSNAMELLLLMLALASELLLVAAAFVYLFDPDQARRLLRRFRIPLMFALAVFVAPAAMTAAKDGEIVFGLFIMSVVAYFIRERRTPKREKTQSFSGAERKPLLPSTELVEGDDADKEPEQ